MKLERRDWWYVVSSVLCVVFIAWAVVIDETPEWKDHQRTFYKMLAEKMEDPNLAKIRPKMQGMWMKTFFSEKIDRCQTCHLGIDKAAFSDAPQPFRAHPFLEGWMAKHPFDKFGCTVCHDGDGNAVRYEKVHGGMGPDGKGSDVIIPKENQYWQGVIEVKPKMNTHLKRGKFVETGCTRCHAEIFLDTVDFPETPTLMEGKKMVRQLGCGACHTIKQLGLTGLQAPELSNLGSRAELSFYLIHDFRFIEGGDAMHTKKEWEFQHFLDPQKIVPGDPAINLPPTIMPNFNLTREEAEILTVFVLSLREAEVEKIPAHLRPILRLHEDFITY